MLVFGDSFTEERADEHLRQLTDSIHRLWGKSDGVCRHGELVSAFICAGELAQGIADAAFDQTGRDARSPVDRALMRLLIELAGCIRRSWMTGFAEIAAMPREALQSAYGIIPRQTIRISRPEGYAFYALYPETYIEAGAALAGRPAKIIGLRSIGTGLSAAVAVGAGLSDAITLRPIGDPFGRKIALAPELGAEILADCDAIFAIVDEGPGLSGSSFGSVADYLEEAGVAPQRLHFFPAHRGNPGPKAAAHHRQRWGRVRRHVVEFDELFVCGPDSARGVEKWFRDLLGRPTAPLMDLSGGAWRARHFTAEREWPASNRQQERRKFLLHAESGPWLLKFAGLGPYGAEKLPIAEALASARFTPPVAGYRHGFLAERWLEGARPLRRAELANFATAEHLGSYLGFRARHLRTERPGASLEELWRMTRRNIAVGLGPEWAARLDDRSYWSPRLERAVVPVRTDSRLMLWEWLVADDRLVKVDAIDHHASHDLVGCQDVAWDVVGAQVEFQLSTSEFGRLCTIVEREAGRPLRPDLLEFLTPCYLAFHLGYFSLAAESNAADPQERGRLRSEADRYGRALRACLGRSLPGAWLSSGRRDDVEGDRSCV